MGRASRSSATAASRCSAAARRPRKRERPPAAPPADPMNAPETIIPAEAPPAQEDKRAAVPLGKRVRRLVMQLGPSRMAATIVFLLAAILIARFSWQLPLLNAAERALYDARASLMAPKVEPDGRLTLVTYNDEKIGRAHV